MINIKLNIASLSFLTVIMTVQGGINTNNQETLSNLAQMNAYMMMDPWKMIAQTQAMIARQTQMINEQNAKRMAKCKVTSEKVYVIEGDKHTITYSDCEDGSKTKTTKVEYSDGRVTTNSKSYNGQYDSNYSSDSSSSSGSNGFTSTGSQSSSTSNNNYGSSSTQTNDGAPSGSGSGNNAPPSAVASSGNGAASSASSSGGGGAMAMSAAGK